MVRIYVDVILLRFSGAGLNCGTRIYVYLKESAIGTRGENINSMLWGKGNECGEVEITVCLSL
jgi:hypothetical protein